MLMPKLLPLSLVALIGCGGGSGESDPDGPVHAHDAAMDQGVDGPVIDAAPDASVDVVWPDLLPDVAEDLPDLPPDLGPDVGFCGDAICNTGLSEDPCTCPADCIGDCCGDALCTGAETDCNCATDCDAACGDGCCTGIEDDIGCAEDCGCAAVAFCGDFQEAPYGCWCDPCCVDLGPGVCCDDADTVCGYTMSACGNGQCNIDCETSATCPGDCP